MIFDNTPKYISNSRFKQSGKSGTGNSTCPVSKDEQVRLQNHLIDESVVADFMQTLYDMGEDVISVELSHRQTTQRWGTAWTLKRRVVLYRHTAWTFLHEVAHIINDGDARNEAEKANAPYYQYKRKAHGRSFGKYQEMLYDLWMEHIEPRWDDLKKAALNNEDCNDENCNCKQCIEKRKAALLADKYCEPKVDPVKAEFERAFVAGKFGMMVSVCVDPTGQGEDLYVDNKGRIRDYQVWLNFLKFETPPTTPKLKRHFVTGGDVKAGDKVWFWNGKRKTHKIYGIVKRVNLKTCRITNTTDGTDWRVSPTLLNKEI